MDTGFESLVDLAAERLGGSVLYASDDFFASKDNLLKSQEAVFIEGKYTDRGKWMDGWESRRKREYAPAESMTEDFAIIRLGLSGIIRGVVVDTSFFKGNYPKSCSLEGASIEGHPDIQALLSKDVAWTKIFESDLKGDSKNPFAVTSSQRFTHLRFKIFPDGGVARLRVHGDVVPHARVLARREVDLAAAENGALVVACNDMFFGSRHNLIMPGYGVNMGDGWETKRSRRAGPDWVVVRLATEGVIERAIVDTRHFKGNAPDHCAIDVATSEGDPDGASDGPWRPLLAKTRLQPHTQHAFEDELAAAGEATHVRLRIWPDGGISRLRLVGVASAKGRENSGLRWLRSLPESDLGAALKACCGSSAWASRIAKDKPFASIATFKARAAEVWSALSHGDWDEAFRAHPRIGETKGEKSANHGPWAAKEQSKVAHASQAILDELRAVNEAYEEKFGRIYIVCATGKSAEEMLAIAKERMNNAPAVEIERAADEQRKITDLRIDKLVLR